jgi:hypothetical protein
MQLLIALQYYHPIKNSDLKSLLPVQKKASPKGGFNLKTIDLRIVIIVRVQIQPEL